MTHYRQQKASYNTLDMDHTTHPSYYGKESAVCDQRGQKRDRPPDTDHTRKSQKITDMSHERIDESHPDYTSGTGPSITCKHLLLPELDVVSYFYFFFLEFLTLCSF